jgi:hypothetical protein
MATAGALIVSRAAVGNIFTNVGARVTSRARRASTSSSTSGRSKIAETASRALCVG